MKIAIAGLGTVGAGVVQLLSANAAEIEARAGKKIEIVAISSRSRENAKNRGVEIEKYQWFDNPVALATTNADTIIEAIGGEDGIAYELAKSALKSGKNLITANKAMLARHGGELAELAEENKVSLHYEAAVAGGIPVIKALREGLAGNKFTKVAGILNGTCNFILSQMEARGEEFPAILDEAKAKGYAEADPTFDVGGFDAASKLALLSANAFGNRPNFDAIHIEGIQEITVADIEYAKKLGYKIKHLCITSNTSGEIEQRAHPCLIPFSDPLAGVNDVFNAVQIEGSPIGRLTLTGRGAGAGPTASAVVADIIDIANGRKTFAFTVPAANLGSIKSFDINEISSEYYLRLQVADKPGVLEDVTHLLREQSVSVKKILQEEAVNGHAQVVIITQKVKESAFRKAVEKLAKLDSLEAKPQVIRILA